MQRKSLSLLMLSVRSLLKMTKEREVWKKANSCFTPEYTLQLVPLKTYRREQFTEEEIFASAES